MCNALNHSSGCTCGWGGDGHLGRNYDHHERSNWYKLTDSFCIQSQCPNCGQYVYFVRHNGGSVWFDELGKPWPKHSCFYSTQKVIKDGISNWLANLTEPLIGVVVEVSTDDSKYISIFCSDDAIHKMRVLVKFSISGFLNEFVILSSVERRLVRPYLSLETVLEIDNERVLGKRKEGPTQKSTMGMSRWNCAFCSNTFTDTQSLAIHLKSHKNTR